MLTARQELLLKSIIQEFIDSAEAVGSLSLSKKYDLDVSPATIRNEMAALTELGLLMKTHASSGRVPTSRAIKLFLQKMLDDYDDLDAVTITRIRENLFQRRFNADVLISEAVKYLTELTGSTSVGLLAGRRYTAGVKSFLREPEFRDLEKLQLIIDVIEDYDNLQSIFERYTGRDVEVLIGEDIGVEGLTDSAIVFSGIKLHGEKQGYISVVGSNRMQFRKVIPVVKYVAASIEEVVSGW